MLSLTAAIAGAAAVTAIAPAARAQHVWPQYGGSATHGSIAASIPAQLTASPTWALGTDLLARPINFIGQSGPVCTRDFVLAYGSVAIATQRVFFLYGVDRRTGALRWSFPIPAPTFDSWSTPVIDLRNQVAVCAVNNRVMAASLKDGSLRWQTPTLAGRVVDASPIITDDITVANRVFITTYDGLGESARLYCINADPFVPNTNPYQPGTIVWSAAIGGTSGSTPAYARNDQGIPTVYVASLGFGYPDNPSIVLAFRADTDLSPFPSWVTENPKEGAYFFSGVALAHSAGRLCAYVASYNFDAPGASDPPQLGLSNANLIKLDANSGQVIWSVDCNRTSAAPIPLPDGRIVLSSGICGFGSASSIELFQDFSTSAVRIWNTALSTWFDTNQDTRLDPTEFLHYGGWTHQPVAVFNPNVPTGPWTLYAGGIPCVDPDTCAPFCPTPSDPCTDLYVLDLAQNPGSQGFVKQHVVGAGSNPALADSNLYTIGAAGLIAFGPPPPNFDVNGDQRVDVDDLYAYLRGTGQRDVNLDGSVTSADQQALEAELRRGEPEDMRGGRQ